MSRRPGTFNMASNLEMRVSAPLDARLVVATKTELYDYEFPYSGMLVSVQEDKTVYMLVGADPTKEESWKKVGDNGVELTLAEYNALTDEQKMNGTVYYITDGVPQPNVFSLLTVELEDGNGVAHTYEILGREVVNP